VFLLRAAATRLDMQVRAPDDRSLDGRHESRGQGLMLRGSAAKALAEAATRPPVDPSADLNVTRPAEAAGAAKL
jgi:hypothetical protein